MRRPQSPLGLAFFGQTQSNPEQYRLKVFSTIHEIVFHGGGGYDWLSVYSMPIWLRKFTFQKIQKWYKAKEEAQEGNSNSSQSKNLIDPDGKLNKNAIPKLQNNKSSYK